MGITIKGSGIRGQVKIGAWYHFFQKKHRLGEMINLTNLTPDP